MALRCIAIVRCRAKQVADDCKCRFDLRSLPLQLAPRDVGEFVQNLHADNAALSEQRIGADTALIAGLELKRRYDRIGQPDRETISPFGDRHHSSR